MEWFQEAISSLSGVSKGSSSLSSSLQKDGHLSKEQLLDFFKAGEQALRSEGTRRKLKDAKLLKQDVEEKVTQMQKKIFESQGVDGEFGVNFLSQVSTIYKNNNEVMAALLAFVSLEEDALDEAELSQAEYEQKQRLMELAKAHTAQLMAKLEELPVDQRQAFLQEQLKVAQQLRENVASGSMLSSPQPSGKGLATGDSSMSQEDKLRFFSALE